VTSEGRHFGDKFLMGFKAKEKLVNVLLNVSK
jgi:hypothetical protein